MDILDIRKYLLKHEGFTPFSQVNAWSYSGAEPFADGSAPIIKETEEFDIIFDGNGMSFESEDDSVCFDLA